MLDLNTLHTFTYSNGIYAGVNKSNFKSIEFWLQAIVESKVTPPKPNALGLFGPASTGKTTAASVISNAINTNLITVNCATITQETFWETVWQTGKLKYPSSPIHSTATSRDSNPSWFYLQYCTILLDECHMLPSKVQGQLLSLLDGSCDRIYGSKRNFCFKKDITWILSTTDSGKLLYPLSTRLHSIVLNEYSEEDVVEIVKLNYPEIQPEAALVLSRAAKLVPRIAIDLTKQYVNVFKSAGFTRETALSYVGSIRQTNEYGLDSTDEKILSMLKESKITLSKAKQLDKNIINKKLALFDMIVDPSQEQLTEAIKLQEAIKEYEEQEEVSPNMPRSRQDISIYCRLYDMRDLELRLGYMEKLGLVAKTKSGIQWKKDIV